MRKRKIFTAMLLAVVLAEAVTTPAAAAVPYQSFNYNYWGDIVSSPAPYEPLESVDGSVGGKDGFTLPGDMAVAENGDIYVADTGNNRIVVLDSQFHRKQVVSGFDNRGKKESFRKPGGIVVSADGNIHIADTDNHRIVSLKPDGTLLRRFGVPKNNLTGGNFIFEPEKIGIDGAGRYYVVAKNVFQGLMNFDRDGNFFGFFGTIKVQSSLADKFWKLVATQAQKAQMQLFIPTEFSNLNIDADGFVYATDLDYSSKQTIRRINPRGIDVLVNYNTTKPICGDLSYRSSGPYSGPTKFVDIKVRDKGIYSALDATRGRVYTYDSEGNLLYVFGGMGNELGTFKMPAAIETWKDRIYVLDQNRGRITVFGPTHYGSLINTAVGLRYDGEESKAVTDWQDVLKLDSHYELAYDGIGKSLLAANKNKEAMAYLKKGMDKRYYSVAFRRYRTEWLKENSWLGAAVVLVILAAVSAKKIYRKTKKGRKNRGKA